MSRWQIFMGLLVAIGFASFFYGVSNRTQQGTFGLSLSSGEHIGSQAVVTAVDPNSPAARAGIRSGDRVRFRSSFRNRVIFYATVPGDRITITDRNRTTTLTAAVLHSSTPQAFIAVVELARITFLVMAALIAWRRPDDKAARALAVLLVCFGIGITFDVGILPWVWTRFALLMFMQTLFLSGAVAALVFASRFPAVSQKGFRASIDRGAAALAIIGVVLAAASAALLFALPIESDRERALLELPFLAFYIGVIVATLFCLLDGYRSSSGTQRLRARWALGSIAFGVSGILIFLIAAMTGHNGEAAQYFVLTTFVIPFGLAYAIFRHRMLDITFVINRAVVYTAVSIVIVGLFIFFEWLLGLVVEQNSRESITLQLLAALALGLSTRFIHARVDRFVDNLFFRERHAAEAAVRRFSREASLITTEHDLVTKTVDVAVKNMHLRGAAFYALRSGAFAPLYSTIADSAAVGENDYAILEMRTWHTPVEPSMRGSMLRGDAAFPMMVRGSLAGFLLCAEKETHETLAPDERDALSELAISSGVALDSLRVRELEFELRDLSRDASLPHPIRAKLTRLLPHPSS
ncbi:MAG: hypothetical protein JOZ77_08345 [Candidatus Eremiobacteraeota bacterium]|nr:hypothetical protein [Candidatus Eremiobacteraeota bacterium]